MFIRTKDKVYKVIREDEDGYWDIVDGIYIFKTDILKQSDNLAELCDEFVYNNQILSEEDRYNEEYLSQLYWFNDVYGAIWTDKGLIYVAKMNEEGKLELL